MAIQTLSFRLRVARSMADLRAACRVREACYGRHLPRLAGQFDDPDDADMDPHTVVLLCEDKLTGAPIGTARVEVSTRGGPLPIERCITLGPDMLSAGRAEITRLAALAGADPLARLLLWKAGYLYCIANQARWLLIGARSKALVRSYRRLGAVHLHADERMVPLDYTGHIPHYVLKFDAIAAERTWHSNNHALFDFMFNTVHPDLQLFAPADHTAVAAMQTVSGTVAA